MDTNQARRKARYERFLDDPFLLALRGAARHVRECRAHMREAEVLQDEAFQLQQRFADSPRLMPLVDRVTKIVAENIALTSEVVQTGLADLQQVLDRESIYNSYYVNAFAAKERPYVQRELAELQANQNE